MRKGSRWLFAQADSHYKDFSIDYLFLFSPQKSSGEVVWDMRDSEWVLDGVGHSSFRLELLW